MLDGVIHQGAIMPAESPAVDMRNFSTQKYETNQQKVGHLIPEGKEGKGEEPWGLGQKHGAGGREEERRCCVCGANSPAPGFWAVV